MSIWEAKKNRLYLVFGILAFVLLSLMVGLSFVSMLAVSIIGTVLGVLLVVFGGIPLAFAIYVWVDKGTWNLSHAWNEIWGSW